MVDYINLKEKFKQYLSKDLANNPDLKHLLYEVYINGGCAYIVGGYLRSAINSIESRDIDIIIDLENLKLIKLITETELNYTINRHQGIKIHLPNIDVDMWSIENNWAFKKELVKLNENDKLNSIAKGCFYNYDALVIALHKNYNMNIQYYNQFKKNGVLDILQKSPIYKILNPTIEANILRAFYLKKTQGIEFSYNAKKYLIDMIGGMKDKGKNPIDELCLTLSKYEKYQKELNRGLLIDYLGQLYDSEDGKQFFLNF